MASVPAATFHHPITPLKINFLSSAHKVDEAFTYYVA